MIRPDLLRLDRRRFLQAAAGATALAAFAPPAFGARATGTNATFALKAATGKVALVPDQPATAVWCYDGRVPGPEIRARQGQRLKVAVANALPEPTTVHWHGIRLPNAMDGVPGLTQRPIAPGETFPYDFALPDAGTYWYHPHQQSDVQVGRGLAGPLIVEEAEPVAVDRDVTWVLSDWRLEGDAQIKNDFGNFMDLSHDGRLGNTVTVNGRVVETFPVRAHERIRLRLINVANARIFALAFAGHRPWVIAYDGQPVEPHRLESDRIVLGPAMRADLLIDMTGQPGEKHSVMDVAYKGREYRLLHLAYEAGAPTRPKPLEAPIRLPDNPLPEPDLASAERHRIVVAGGMMGQSMGLGQAGPPVDLQALSRRGLAWAVNGVAGSSDHRHAPLLTLRKDRAHVIELVNDTAWQHPIHLHGHSFRVLTRNGAAHPLREWRDTVLLAPRERVEIAFVADNPGDWMLHCHILEHQVAGMMATFRVA